MEPHTTADAEPIVARRRRAMVVLVVLAAVALLGGAVVAIVFHASDGRGDDGVILPDVESSDDMDVRTHWVLGDRGEWETSGANDASFDVMSSPAWAVALFAAEPMSGGEAAQWLAVTTFSAANGAGEIGVATSLGMAPGDATEEQQSIDVNGIAARRDVTFDGVDLISFNIDELVVSVRSSGVDETTALAFARAIRITDGQVAIDTTRQHALGSNLDLIHVAGGRGMLLPGFQDLSFGPVSVNYSRTAPDGWLTLSHTSVQGTDPIAAARALLSDEVDIDVGGNIGVAGRASNNTVVIWTDADGTLVMLTGALPLDEAIELASSARQASAAEWNDLLDISSFGGEDERTSGRSLVVAAGDHPDRSDWTVTADFDDGLVTCVESDFGSTCSQPHAADPPYLVEVRGADTAGVLAVSTPTGPDLRLEIVVDGDTAATLPLVTIDPSFPGPAAAYASKRPFTARLVTSSGDVVDSVEVDP